MSMSPHDGLSEQRECKHDIFTDISGARSVDSTYQVVFMDPKKFRPSEHHCKIKAEKLSKSIERGCVWTTPILADLDTMAVMDGHHRLAASLRLGLTAIPAVLLSYSDPRLAVQTWREGEEISRSAIQLAASSGRLLPFKTTRHILELPLPDLRIPLAGLI